MCLLEHSLQRNKKRKAGNKTTLLILETESDKKKKISILNDVGGRALAHNPAL